MCQFFQWDTQETSTISRNKSSTTAFGRVYSKWHFLKFVCHLCDIFEQGSSQHFYRKEKNWMTQINYIKIFWERSHINFRKRPRLLWNLSWNFKQLFLNGWGLMCHSLCCIGRVASIAALFINMSRHTRGVEDKCDRKNECIMSQNIFYSRIEFK